MFKNKFGRKSNKTYEDIHFTCTIRFLDDSEPITVTFQKDTKGQWLLDYVCRELNLVEKDYFGLRYVDTDKQRHWLDPWKGVYRQLKHVTPMVLCFRVKFYPTDPMKLKEEITRYFLFLQLRRDLHHGRLLCSPADANMLAAYIIQSEVGDFDPADHPADYVSQFKMLPKQTQRQEEKIHEIHKTLTGHVPSEAEGNFLKKACTLDTYGVDPHPVKKQLKISFLNEDKIPEIRVPVLRRQDQKGNQMYLGVTHLGIVTFQGNKRTHLFKWPQVNKIAFEGKMFIVHVTISEKKHACGFKCPTFSACKHLWKCAVEQQYFFTLANGGEAPKVTSGGGLFTRGSKFRFSGKCQKEVYADSAGILRDQPNFVRSASNPQFVRSFNKLRSTSMPNKLKDKGGDINEEPNEVSDNVTPAFETTVEVNEPKLDESMLDEPILESSKETKIITSVETRIEPTVQTTIESIIETTIETTREEVVVEKNKYSGSSMELPNGRDMSSTEVIEHSIPEEVPVVLADVPYQPLQSPLREELPPLPVTDQQPADEDLDREIEKLQSELDRCKKANWDEKGSNKDEAPSYETITTVRTTYVHSTPNDYIDGPLRNRGTNDANKTLSQPNNNSHTAALDKKSKKNCKDADEKPSVSALLCKILRFFLVTVLMFALMLCVLSVVAMETDAPIPLIQNLRSWSGLQHFKDNHYVPRKEATFTAIKGWFS